MTGTLIIQNRIGGVISGLIPHASNKPVKLLAVFFLLSRCFGFSFFIFESPLGKDIIYPVE
jgi:hypothetical protein